MPVENNKNDSLDQNEMNILITLSGLETDLNRLIKELKQLRQKFLSKDTYLENKVNSHSFKSNLNFIATLLASFTGTGILVYLCGGISLGILLTLCGVDISTSMLYNLSGIAASAIYAGIVTLAIAYKVDFLIKKYTHKQLSKEVMNLLIKVEGELTSNLDPASFSNAATQVEVLEKISSILDYLNNSKNDASGQSLSSNLSKINIFNEKSDKAIIKVLTLTEKQQEEIPVLSV